ncbi:MAG TPA: ATP synthase F1 subunit delta [Cyclobacteriaceae bacterium]|nr:ATP synthase F1 subunit delta [Cyclobacteriaceae bacterium]
MASTRVSSRYVKSLLDLAVEQGKLEEVHTDMLLFDAVCRENRNFVVMLRNPVIKHDKKREILERLFSGKVSNLTKAIFDIITRKNREALLPEIARGFYYAYNRYKGIGNASVVTVMEIDDALRKQFSSMAREISGDKQVDLVEKIDPAIIGGFVLNVGDQQINASLRKKLSDLKMKLRYNPYIKEY